MSTLMPDMGKIVYLAIGFFVAPKLLKLVKR